MEKYSTYRPHNGGVKRSVLQKIFAVKISIVPALLLFAIMLAVGVALAANSKIQKPEPVLTRAAEQKQTSAPSYGYSNPRVQSAQGSLRVPPGSTQVPAFVFNVYAPTDRPITTVQYQLAYVNNAGLITKFSLLKDGVKLGATAPGPGYGQITFNSPVTVAAGTYARFVIEADVLSKVLPPPVYGYPTPPSFSVGVQTINYTDTKPSVIEGLPLTNTVTVAYTDPVVLGGSLGSSTPSGVVVDFDKKDVDMTHIKFTGSYNQDVVLKKLSIGVTGDTAKSPIRNVRLYDRDTGVLLATISELNQSYQDISIGVATLTNALIIPKGATKTIRIVGDVQLKQNTTTKKVVQFSVGLVGLAGQDPIIFTGPLPLYGNAVTLRHDIGIRTLKK